MLAATYPLLDAFFTTLWIVGFVLWIWLAVLCFSDIFRSRDMSGWVKAIWVVVILFLPLLGVLMYLLVRGRRMYEHAETYAEEQEQATREYIRGVVGGQGDGQGTADEIAKLAQLRESGALTQEEFDREKSRVLRPAS